MTILPITSPPRALADIPPAVTAETTRTPVPKLETYTIVHTGIRKEAPKDKSPTAIKTPITTTTSTISTTHSAKDDLEPLIDTTAPLSKNSKKTRRLQKQLAKRQYRASFKVQNFLELPTELLYEVLGHCRPSDIVRLSRLNRFCHDFINEHENSIAKDIIARRYSILHQCFPLPIWLSSVDDLSQTALLHPRREKMTEVHKKPYQHIKPPDSTLLCTCASCLLAWNNLNIILDLAEFQDALDKREPIPMIARGTQPAWNVVMLERHARIVVGATGRVLVHAWVLERHLDTVVRTLGRQLRGPVNTAKTPMHRHSKPVPMTAFQASITPPPTPSAPSSTTSSPPHPPNTTPTLPYAFHPSSPSALSGSDNFLSRFGKESYELPWHRDNYYAVVAYIPNRKWSRVEQRWMYYSAGGHERDLEWVRKWFLPSVSIETGNVIGTGPALVKEVTGRRVAPLEMVDRK